MAINPNADFNDLSTWLNENLSDKKRIRACCKEVNKVPELKGIYFWFIRPDGYNALSNFVEISPIESRFSKDIDGIIFDLVYLGTAGTRNNKNGINNGHLRKRLKWHLCDNKNVSALCSKKKPIMSTLRSTIGGLISDDLIENNTQDNIDELLCKYFVVYYIEYPGAFLEVKDEVNNDEDILINVIRPVFNIKKNPNADDPNQLTFKIQEKKQQIINSSRNKWCNIDNTSRKPKLNIPYQSKDILSELISERGCIEFNVKQNESAHFNIQSFIFQAKTKYSINIFETIKPANFICTFYSFTKIPKKYFGNSDTEPKRYINRRGPARWKVIQKEMIENKIQEVTIRLCPLQKNNNNKPNSKIEATSKTPKLKSQTNIQNPSIDKKINELIQTLDWDKLKNKKNPKLLIIACCDAKSHQPINLANGGFVNYDFGANIINQRLARINFYQGLPVGYFNNIIRNGGLVNMNYFMASLNNNNRREALDVYGSNRSPFYTTAIKRLYRIKIKKSELHLLIVSGLYGIINHKDYINDYHLKINKGQNVWGNFISLAVSQYIQANSIDNDAVFYSLSGNYLPLLQPNPLWKNLWLNHGGRGHNQANDLRDFLNQL